MRTILMALLMTLTTQAWASSKTVTEEAQRLLNYYGFDSGTVDGVLGPKTRKAIIDAYSSIGASWDNDLDETDIAFLRERLITNHARRLSGVNIENLAEQQIIFPPEKPGITRSRYWFGRFWVQADWNNDGLMDYLFTGTMVPIDVNSVGDDTSGACGGSACKGKMPGPTLFLQQKSRTFEDRSELFVDNRAEPGQSLSRQNLVADFNLDGILDLFIADHALGTHNGIRDSYFLSQKDGSWLESSNSHLSNPNYRIFDHGGAVGDIDGDGDFDIVLTELKNQLTCWVNDGTGKLKKSICGSVNAFAIELSDMDLDGDLDLVHAGHEYGGSTPTGIAFNNGQGKFRSSKRLPSIKSWGTVPELSLWDLDADGDTDIVLSRAGRLYVGTGIQIIENKGDGTFSSQFYPIIEAPKDYKPVHEGNEWNNFVAKILFSDVDRDGDDDIILSGGGSGTENTRKVRGAILRNEGRMTFEHISQGSRGNPVKVLSASAFSDTSQVVNELSFASGKAKNTNASRAFEEFLKNKDIEVANINEFFLLDKPVAFARSGASVIGISNPRFEGLGGRYDLLIEWANRSFAVSVCVDYYKQYDFTGTRVIFQKPYGFGNVRELEAFGTHECRISRGGAIGAWEISEAGEMIGLKAFLEDLQQNGRVLISLQPDLTVEERIRLLGIFK